MSSTPPAEVVEAILNGRITSLRRVELYESDGVTRWLPAGADEPVSRLIGGSISLDYSRDERRALDSLQLDNTDNALRQDANGGLWYDKVVKAYRGVRYQTDSNSPKVAIVYENTAGQADDLKAILLRIGFTRVDVKLEAVTVEDLRDYEIVISHGASGAAGKASLMADLFEAGKKVMTTGNASTSAEVPLIYSSDSPATIDWGIMQVPYDNPVKTGWTTESVGSEAGVPVMAVRAAARVVASYLNGVTIHHTAFIEENFSTGGRWFHYHPQLFETQSKVLLRNALIWLWNYTPFKEWETQIGEFVIDRITEDHFPHVVSITGRDYTKRCLTSKLEQSARFVAGTSIEALVRAVGANAGVTKFNIQSSDKELSESLDFERGTERWRIMADAAASNNFELFFDAQGYLTMREFLDPSFSPISQAFKTGPSGNLVSWSRSTDDSRIYNHMVITGEAEGENAIPFFGEAINDEPSSPTRVGRIGDRSYFFSSSFFTSDQQCVDLANSWLKVHALESYEIDFSSLLYPWQEVGEIIEFIDPRAIESDPTRFLLDSLSIPLALGPMSGTGKRVTFVQDSTTGV